MNLVHIIIVNYKSEGILADAIKSFDEDNVDINITVLDNESTSCSFEKLKEIDNIEIIRSEKNLGFAGGCNYAYEWIEKKYTDLKYVFFFNPDAISTTNLIGDLLEGLLQNKKIAAISPKILTMENEQWFTGTQVNWKDCRIINNPKLQEAQEMHEIDVFNGCAVLMDAEKFRESGKFNEELFLYYDEVFLAMRFKEKNYVNYYDPNSLAFHHVSFSAGDNSPLKTYYMMRNHLYFFKRYSTRGMICHYRQPIKNFFYYLKRYDTKNMKAILNAYIHYIFNIKGKL